jgi:MurNAc alpha-1-phosphate uridylyltransferase
MNAMILAAGRGERMRPLTDSCPKPLLEVCSKPLIVYHLEALAKAGIDSVVINVSWMSDRIIQALGDGSSFGLQIEYSPEAQALETAGGIIQALAQLDDQFIVVNADVFTDYDFSRLLNPTRPAHLVLVPNPEHHPDGDFSIQQGLLSNEPGECYTFSGIASYQKSFFIDQQKGRRPLAPMLRQGAAGRHISAELYNGFWTDVGTIDRLQSLQQGCEE